MTKNLLATATGVFWNEKCHIKMLWCILMIFMSHLHKKEIKKTFLKKTRKTDNLSWTISPFYFKWWSAWEYESGFAAFASRMRFILISLLFILISYPRPTGSEYVAKCFSRVEFSSLISQLLWSTVRPSNSKGAIAFQTFLSETLVVKTLTDSRGKSY